jgi:hypothetical protein
VEIVCLQTADPFAYYEMLYESSKTVRLYCKHKGIIYHSYIGIKRGYFSWHASFNRIYMIKEMLDGGFRGWILYVDADAYIANLKFDLAGYLNDKHGYAMILRPGAFTGEFCDVNIGVMLVNGASERARWLVDQWLSAFLQVPDDSLKRASDWGSIAHDQELFQKILSDNPDHEPFILKDLTQTLHSGPEGGGAAFIEQVIRAVTGDEQERQRIIRWNVAEALRRHGLEADPAQTASRNAYKLETVQIVTAVYEGLLGRPPDEHQLEFHTEAFARSGLAYVVRDLMAGAEFRSRFRGLCGYDSAQRSPMPRGTAGALGTLCGALTDRLGASLRFGRNRTGG